MAMWDEHSFAAERGILGRLAGQSGRWGRGVADARAVSALAEQH